MSAQVIRMATDPEDGPAQEPQISFHGDSVFSALRQAVFAGFPEMLPSIYSEHAAMLSEALPGISAPDLAQALRKLAYAPGIRNLRRASSDPRKLVMTLAGAALAFSGPLEGLRPAPVTATSQAQALSFLGLPGHDSAQWLDDVAAAIRVGTDTVLAAFAIVPQLPHLRGTLAQADRFTALPVAGIVFALTLTGG